MPDMRKVADAINCLSTFLAHEQIHNSREANAFPQPLGAALAGDHVPGLPTDAIVLCTPAVLSVAEKIFSAVPEVSAAGVPSAAEKISL